MGYFENKNQTVTIDNKFILIERSSATSAVKSLFAGRTMGKTIIRVASISGLYFSADMLTIMASGFNGVIDGKLSHVDDIKRMPNTVVGKPEELEQIYNAIVEVM
ncbi:hypothetical protein [Desulforamulus reducens]|uniref:hypothetical protein n=1 Tax=Desulforamulus reducens TaxID=59610 RepID=UPI00059B7A50|nr:hypothetical protein [Desulforamulus reducens]